MDLPGLRPGLSVKARLGFRVSGPSYAIELKRGLGAHLKLEAEAEGLVEGPWVRGDFASSL